MQDNIKSLQFLDEKKHLVITNKYLVDFFFVFVFTFSIFVCLGADLSNHSWSSANTKPKLKLKKKIQDQQFPLNILNQSNDLVIICKALFSIKYRTVKVFVFFSAIQVIAIRWKLSMNYWRKDMSLLYNITCDLRVTIYQTKAVLQIEPMMFSCWRFFFKHSIIRKKRSSIKFLVSPNFPSFHESNPQRQNIDTLINP